MLNPIIFCSKDKELIVTYLYTVDNYFTFKIKIRSGEFEGASNFCISKEVLISIINCLHNMYNELVGSCTLHDYDSDAYLAMEMQKFGHMCLHGQIGGSHEEHNMRFRFIIDQTALANLMEVFKAVL